MTTDKQRQHIQNWRDKNPERYRELNSRCHKAWYENNHDRICEDRRERRVTDPDYKAKAIANSDAHKAKVRAGHMPEPDAIYRTIDGLSVRLYRSSEAARMIDCAPINLCQWERQGWLPAAFFDRRRLYTREQIDLIALFYSVDCHDFFARTEASKFIFKKW
jgi:hypothetical protein